MSRPLRLLALTPLLAPWLTGCDVFPSYPEYPGTDTDQESETGDSDWSSYYTDDYSDYDYDYSSYYDYTDYYYYDYYDYDYTGGDTALIAIAFYLEADIYADGSAPVMDAQFGVISYGVASGYVDFDDHLCSWYAFNSEPAQAIDCIPCEFAFSASLELAGESGERCDVLKEGLGPYGYTGPSYFIQTLDVGFVMSGSGAYDGFYYDYGDLAFYLGYPYYYWYTSPSYAAYIYAVPDGELATTHLSALNGYYGVTWTP